MVRRGHSRSHLPSSPAIHLHRHPHHRHHYPHNFYGSWRWCAIIIIVMSSEHNQAWRLRWSTGARGLFRFEWILLPALRDFSACGADAGRCPAWVVAAQITRKHRRGIKKQKTIRPRAEFLENRTQSNKFESLSIMYLLRKVLTPIVVYTNTRHAGARP